MKARYDQLRSKLWSMPRGVQRLSTMEEAIRLADAYMTKHDAYDIRMEYTDEALMSGYEERIFVSFGWCLSAFEREPGEYNAHTILWHYKWLLGQVWKFPQFPLALINRIFEDFRTKCEAHGYALGPYYKNLRAFAVSRGDLEAAKRYYEEWKRARRDALSDCSACDHHAFGSHHYAMGHHKRGLQKVKPIFDGKVRCRSVPKRTYSEALLPLLEAGRPEQAKLIAHKGYRLLEDGRGDLGQYIDYLQYYTITDLPKAKKIVEQMLPHALQTKVDWLRFEFLTAVQLFLEEWKGGKRRTRLKVPAHATLEWVAAETERLADAFDKRNGTSHSLASIEAKRKQMRGLASRIERL